MDQDLNIVEKGRFQGACYRDTGSGFPVMLVHGFPVDGTLWDYQAARLKNNFRLLIPDLPGSGKSPLNGETSMEEMADFLYDILEETKVEKCVLIGHSMGGYIALAFAEKYPDRLRGFGLFHSSALADTEEKKKGRERSINMMNEYGAGVFLRQMMPTLFSRSFKENRKAAMNALIKSKENAGVDALSAYYRAMMKRPDRTHILRQTKVPVLFVIGKEDTAAPEKDVLKQTALPKISDVHILTDVAHLGMLEKPEEATNILEEFIRFCQDMNRNELKTG